MILRTPERAKDIVLPDADPRAIAEGLFWGAFINNGQTCAAMKGSFAGGGGILR